MDSTPNWIEPIKKGVDESNIVYKKAWYILHGYLIPSENINEFKSWAENQSFWNNWMPDSKEHYQMFNRDFYWSDTYDFFQNPYYGTLYGVDSEASWEWEFTFPQGRSRTRWS